MTDYEFFIKQLKRFPYLKIKESRGLLKLDPDDEGEEIKVLGVADGECEILLEFDLEGNILE